MMNNSVYKHFTTNEITPSGWLKSQLEIEAEGLVGNLDKIWPDIRDSQWIGGSCEGWERVPYWLDGFVPLAWLLDNNDMKARAKRYIDGILERQCEDGWICPCAPEERANYDTWALFIIAKALVVYAECSNDSRIEEALYRAFKNFKDHIRFATISRWGTARWFECFIPLSWLYERRPEPWIKELARTLALEGMNYRLLLDNFTATDKCLDWDYTVHVVNLAMAIKCYAVADDFLDCDGKGFAEEFLDTIRKYHSTAYGLFTGDECLAGSSPTQGAELCAIVEAMYSFETLYEIYGDTKWADRLELLAFNALPATVSNDMWTHQYDQLVNQVSCVTERCEGHLKFTTNSADAHIFGLEPNFGCCTSNMGQGFPKLALSAFYGSRDGIAIGAILPAVLETELNGAHIKIESITEYPFKSTVKYRVTSDRPVDFTLTVRVPENTEAALLNGKSVTAGAHSLAFSGTEAEYELNLTPKTVLDERPNGLFAVHRGALLYSLPIKYEKTMHEYVRDGVERKFPYCDYELTPVGKWSYGLADESFTPVEGEISDYPFSDEKPPIVLKAHLAEIDWGMDPEHPDFCAEVPASNKALSAAVELELYPYGCTSLRITEMPKVE